ncbi:hypothetical protein TcCL_ESM01516 [Trypanosoma cruzi]|nr:hypothetical protein TcCL_ESM01516 [Trypanosoma cruzi]
MCSMHNHVSARNVLQRRCRVDGPDPSEVCCPACFEENLFEGWRRYCVTLVSVLRGGWLAGLLGILVLIAFLMASRVFLFCWGPNGAIIPFFVWRVLGIGGVAFAGL